MRRSERLFSGGFLLGGLVALAGCGDPKPTGPFVPVKGKVTLSGKPLVGGTVMFVPLTGDVKPPLPLGEIDAQGLFSLQTGGRAGAAVGKYRALVTTAGVDKTQESQFDPVYSSWEESPLVVEVAENAPAGAYDFKLSPLRKR